MVVAEEAAGGQDESDHERPKVNVSIFPSQLRDACKDAPTSLPAQGARASHGGAHLGFRRCRQNSCRTFPSQTAPAPIDVSASA
eukprot:3932587-Rhodomonas_salina.2